MKDIKNIDYNALPISEYSRRYILRMLPNLDYYTHIYRKSIHRVLQQETQTPQELTIVDYGGGHGFLSFTLKQMGVGKVIYVDYNSQAVKTVHAIAEHLGYGPDAIIHGDAEALLQYCTEQGIRPNALMGMDVIEHIYRLEDFFALLHNINPDMHMLFTTGSTPFNPRVVNRLRNVMIADEQGPQGFREQRRHHIQHSFRQMSNEQLDYWADNTRGLNYDDTLLAVEHNQPFQINDPYNTCDPATSSWTERILPIEEYQRLVAPYQWRVTVDNGFYNTHRNGSKGISSRLLNVLLISNIFRCLAPFITLNIKR
ncbi:MAG: SAM-dependent methyltransferase [Bacteroidales bacterium]|nr:SAM-dependent methyltransferase [Bacteroidales bacterium]